MNYVALLFVEVGQPCYITWAIYSIVKVWSKLTSSGNR